MVFLIRYIFFLLFSAFSAHGSVESQILFMINNRAVLTTEYAQRKVMHELLTGERLGFFEDDAQEMVIQALADEIIQNNIMKQFGLTIAEEELVFELTRIAEASGQSMATIREKFEDAGVPFHFLKDKIAAQMAWMRYVQGKYGKEAAVSEEAVKRYLEKKKKQLGKVVYYVFELVLYGENKVTLRNRFKAVTEAFTQGVSFPHAVQHFSEAPSAKAKQGALGWRTLESFDPETAKAMEALLPGQVSEPIFFKGGMKVVMMADQKIEQQQPTLAEARNILRFEKLQMLAEKELETHRKGMIIKILDNRKESASF